jgi:hypothetical protein
MLDENGVGFFRLDRITFDGNSGLAGRGFYTPDSVSGDYSGEFTDDVFKNMGIGFQTDNATNVFTFERDQFLNDNKGLYMNGWSVLQFWVWDSSFQNCAYGVSGLGQANVYHSVFQGSTVADVSGTIDPVALRNNYSSGSYQFFNGGNGPLTIQDNTILDTLTTPIQDTDTESPLELIDNVIRNSTSYTGPDVSISGSPQDLISVGNTFGVATSQVSTYQPYSGVPSGQLRAVNNTVVDRSTVNPPSPSQPWLATPQVPSGQKVFETASFDSAGIQNAINAAVAAVNAGTAVNPVVHLQAGTYNLSSTVVIPANVDIQLVGDGYYGATTLTWQGAAGGTVLDLQGPSRANLQDFLIQGQSAGNGILFGECRPSRLTYLHGRAQFPEHRCLRLDRLPGERAE